MASSNIDDGPRDLPSGAVLAHELRSLLAAIRLASTSLRRHFADQDPGGRAAQDIEVIDTAVRRASELTAWVLSAPATINDRAPRVRNVDLAALVTEVMWDLRPIVARHDIHVTGPSNVVMRGDHILVRAIVTNLILNAARRAVDGSAIDIEVRGRDPWAEVTVSTPEWEPTQEELDDLFRPFNALDASLDGHRLDLMAAPVTTESHSGVVVRAERDGGGSALTLRLPLRGRREPPRPPKQARRS